jgi:ATP-dependent DNA helicase MPH1
MLNWFRWAPEGQIAFLAPTKPLVHQQIEACFTIAGIPRSQTATMTGGVPKTLRQEYWEERRVFFTTPQTILNDIRNRLCDPKRIVCLVVDEAHRTTGAYAYGEVMKLVRRENNSFRVLALTATPGSTVEAVQGVIDALGIARVEIRTDESIDIRQYIQRRHLEVQTFPPSDNMTELRDLYCKCLEPMLKKLNGAKAFYQTRAENLTPYGVMMAKKEWMNSAQARNLNKGYFYSLLKIFRNLASLAHALVLLNTHGIRLFYDRLMNARDDQSEEEVTESAVDSIRKEPSYSELIDRAAAIVADPNFSGHPKIDFMINSILKHFAEAQDEDTKRSTRIMVFTSFRESAEEVTRILKRHEPMIRPHVFVGQANTKNSSRMSQKEQLEACHHLCKFELSTNCLIGYQPILRWNIQYHRFDQYWRGGIGYRRG